MDASSDNYGNLASIYLSHEYPSLNTLLVILSCLQDELSDEHIQYPTLVFSLPFAVYAIDYLLLFQYAHQDK